MTLRRKMGLRPNQYGESRLAIDWGDYPQNPRGHANDRRAAGKRRLWANHNDAQGGAPHACQN